MPIPERVGWRARPGPELAAPGGEWSLRAGALNLQSVQGSWGGEVTHEPLKLCAVLHKGRGMRVGGCDLGGAFLIVEKGDRKGTFLEGTHVICFTPFVSGKLEP